MSTNPSLSEGVAENVRFEPFHALNLAASLTVNDIRASMAWYRDIVGFTVEQEHEREGVLRAVVLSAGDVRIVIGQDDGAKGWDRAKGEGFSLRLVTTQDIDDLAGQIKERGGVLESEPTDTPWGVRVFQLKDPSGFKFMISSPPPQG